MNQEEKNKETLEEIFSKLERKRNSTYQNQWLIENYLKIIGIIIIFAGTLISLLFCVILSSLIPLLSIVGSIISGLLIYALGEIIELLREIKNNTKK